MLRALLVEQLLHTAVRGCLEWQRTGLRPPAAVRAATASYRESCDAVGRFLRESFDPAPREMLAKDENVRREFERKITSDPKFASSARARLNFFFERSPYHDQQFNLYPVGLARMF